VTFSNANGWELTAAVGPGNASANCSARCISW
jgi:hypothetical protein